MKKIFSALLLVILFNTTPTFGQDQKIAATTEDEYVMGSVGYKVKDLKDYEYGERKASFKGLYRPSEQQPCAIIMVYTKLRGAPEYYCIPSLDAPESLWDRFRVSLAGETDNKQEQLQFFSFAFAKAMMFHMAK